jgi:hypothetical protein
MAEAGKESMKRPANWWGEFELHSGATAEWRIATLDVTVSRLAHEILVSNCQVETAEDASEWDFMFLDQEFEAGDLSQVSRFAFQDAPERLLVLPALADRPVVSRPYSPMNVLPGELVTIYVGTPLWFTLAAGGPAVTFFEVPILRLSDTWFGPSTMEGETCYSSRTYARLNSENLPLEAEWATTEIQVHNNSADPLPINRLKLPVPYLSLYSTPDGRLWTEDVSMVRAAGESKAHFSIEEDPATLPENAVHVAGPRRQAPKSMLISAFSTLKLPKLG